MGERRNRDGQPMAVAEVMTRAPVCVSPETPTLEVLNLMRQHKIACVPVVKGTQLVGVVTERDFMDITAELLEQRLRT
jgi:CBS domain-containing protein